MRAMLPYRARPVQDRTCPCYDFRPMNLLLATLPVAFGLVYATKIPLAIEMAKSPGGYDNKHPREQQAKLEGRGKRAAAAHANGFESFPPFAAGVLACHVTGASPTVAVGLAWTYVAARVLYPFFYLNNRDAIRSPVWFIGFACSAALLILPLL